MKLSISTSENYSRIEAQDLIMEIERAGVSIEFGGVYHRRSIDDLPPLVLLTLAGVSGGFLQAIGSDAWNQLKKATGSVAVSRRKGVRPSISLVIESDQGDSRLSSLNLDDDISQQLDTALARLVELGEPTNLWYDRETGKWNTLDEHLERKTRK
ncbi:MAG: hypothetical protein M9953_12830 [Thermomicrobiales bacterium]|nr:hypothetical protein [Thermomicrobiales bacterium]MCO5218958.1 hypothetical protein [Thermomicrobiales bacterium]MCO5226216.1 hypothetical protein [Thermomicrobiales bacterium]MCO5228312.1 hypothetical protein [Thermomicrobiales bacterium]